MQFLRKEEVRAQLGYKSISSLQTLQASGLLPQPVKLGMRAVGWPKNEIDALATAMVKEYSAEQLKELVAEMHSKRQALVVSI